MHKSLRIIVLSALAWLPAAALCQTAKADSIAPKDTARASTTAKKDSIPLKLTDRMLKEVVVFGQHLKPKFKLNLNSLEMNLASIRRSDLNFNALGFLYYLFKWLPNPRHRETKAERTQRLLREYDMTAPQLPRKKEAK